MLFRKYKRTKYDEIKYLKELEEDFINKSLRRTEPCSKKPFDAENKVRFDNHISIVDINETNQSVIRRIRTSFKEYYQFIETYFCNECNCYHIKSITQIPRSVMKKHSINI